MLEHYSKYTGHYIDLTHAATSLRGAPTLRNNINRLSNELGVSFFITGRVDQTSLEPDTVTIVECDNFAPQSIRWHQHTESIHLDMNQICVFRGNVSYADLLGAVFARGIGVSRASWNAPWSSPTTWLRTRPS